MHGLAVLRYSSLQVGTSGRNCLQERHRDYTSAFSAPRAEICPHPHVEKHCAAVEQNTTPYLFVAGLLCASSLPRTIAFRTTGQEIRVSGNSESRHGMWSNRWLFVLAAAGSAVGLGNLWRFPYITGENGGGAFVLIYLICIALVGIPIMMAEVLIGREGRQSPVNSMRSLTQQHHRHRAWVLVGWMGVVAGFLILSFYAVIAGWALKYVFSMAGGGFAGASGGPSRRGLRPASGQPLGDAALAYPLHGLGGLHHFPGGGGGLGNRGALAHAPAVCAAGGSGGLRRHLRRFRSGR